MESAYFSLLIEQNWIDPRFLLSSGDGRETFRISGVYFCVKSSTTLLLRRSAALVPSVLSLSARVFLSKKNILNFIFQLLFLFSFFLFFPFFAQLLTFFEFQSLTQKRRGKGGIGIGTRSIDHEGAGMNLIRRKG